MKKFKIPTFNNYIAAQNIQTQINQTPGADDIAAATPMQTDFTGMGGGIDMPTHLLSGEPMIPQQNMPQQVDTTQPQVPMYPANPFERYGVSRVADAPIQYGGGLADGLLNDNEVPEEIRQKFWFIFHKDNVLTFLDEGRQKQKMLNFDILKIDILNAIPYYDYTFERELEFDVLRNVFETKLDRALGIKGQNVKNERIMLQSQFQEQRQISEHGQSQIREGFFKRLLGRR